MDAPEGLSVFDMEEVEVMESGFAFPSIGTGVEGEMDGGMDVDLPLPTSEHAWNADTGSGPTFEEIGGKEGEESGSLDEEESVSEEQSSDESNDDESSDDESDAPSEDMDNFIYRKIEGESSEEHDGKGGDGDKPSTAEGDDNPRPRKRTKTEPSPPQQLSGEEEEKVLQRLYKRKIDSQKAMVNKEIAKLDKLESKIFQTWEWLQKRMVKCPFDEHFVMPEEEPAEGDTERNGANDKSEKEKRQASHTYSLRPDGVYVKVVCPACKKDNFLNLIGAANHCRIQHQLKFANLDMVAAMCGVAVDPSTIPADDPVWQMRALPYHMRNTVVSAHKENHLARIVSAPGAANDSASISGLTASSADPNEELLQYLQANSSKEVTAEQVSRFYVKQNVICGSTSVKIRPDLEQKGKGSSRKGASKRGRGGGTDIDPRATHKWMLYVRSSDEIVRLMAGADAASLSGSAGGFASAGELAMTRFISKIRFFLHPSFKPNDIVEVFRPPYQITRYGWGEFPVRIQIHFHEALQTRPINVVHQLNLSEDDSGLQVSGGETTVELELSRAGLANIMNKLASSPVTIPSTKTVQFDDNGDSNSQHFQPSGESLSSGVDSHRSDVKKSMSSSPDAMEVVVPWVKNAVTRWPLISESSAVRMNSAYWIALDLQNWWRVTPARRRSSEYQRANVLVRECELECGLRVSLSQMVRLCVEHGDVPRWSEESRFPPYQARITREADRKYEKTRPKSLEHSSERDKPEKEEQETMRREMEDWLIEEERRKRKNEYSRLQRTQKRTETHESDEDNLHFFPAAMTDSGGRPAQSVSSSEVRMVPFSDATYCRFCGEVHLPRVYQLDLELRCKKAHGVPNSSTPFAEYKKKLEAEARTDGLSTESLIEVDREAIRSVPLPSSMITAMQSFAAVVGAEIPIADNGGLEISQILWKATSSFAARLIEASVQHAQPRFSAIPLGPVRRVVDMKVLVPRHVHDAIKNNEEYAWLTNEGLQVEEK